MKLSECFQMYYQNLDNYISHQFRKGWQFKVQKLDFMELRWNTFILLMDYCAQVKTNLHQLGTCFIPHKSSETQEEGMSTLKFNLLGCKIFYLEKQNSKAITCHTVDFPSENTNHDTYMTLCLLTELIQVCFSLNIDFLDNAEKTSQKVFVL